MEKKAQDNKISFEPFFHLLFLLGGGILVFAGLVLIVLKAFGYPMLFEGIVTFVLGAMCVYIVKLQSVFLQVVETFSDVLDTANKEMINNNQRIYHPTNFSDGIMQTVNISDEMSPEQLEKMKEQFPHLEGLIDTVMDMSNKKIASPVKTINLSSLSVSQLEVLQKKAVEEENFERAMEIKKEIDKRN